MTSRPSILLILAVVSSCGDRGPTVSEALQQAQARDDAEKAAAQAKVAAKPTSARGGPAELAQPWTVDAVKAHLKPPIELVYDVGGTDASGKAIDDTLHAAIKGADTAQVSTTAYLESEKDSVTAKQLAQAAWTRYSPLFAVEKPEMTIERRESVAVPAGSFECVVGELHGFFGDAKTVYMIIDQPGIYAKVVDHGNVNAEGDKTALVFELRAVTSR